jgi:molybdopterin/thiamine biosynthesis adenylyltransferase
MDVLNPYARVARAAAKKLNEERRVKPLKKRI